VPTLPSSLPAPALDQAPAAAPDAVVSQVSTRLQNGGAFPVPAVADPADLVTDQHRNVYLPLSRGGAVVLTLPFLRGVLSDRTVLRPEFGELLERALSFLQPSTRAAAVAELVAAGKITGAQAARAMGWT